MEEWMSRLPGHCRRLPLWNLALPGSHNSFSYTLSVEEDTEDGGGGEDSSTRGSATVDRKRSVGEGNGQSARGTRPGSEKGNRCSVPAEGDEEPSVLPKSPGVKDGSSAIELPGAEDGVSCPAKVSGSESQGGPSVKLSGSEDGGSVVKVPAVTVPGGDMPPALARLYRRLPGLLRPLVTRWAVTQQLTVLQQLRAGVRYLDLRVSFHDRRPHVVHALHGPLVGPLLHQVRAFVDQHPGEVVLLDIQHVYNAENRDFQLLSELLEHVFGDTLLPACERPSDITLDKCVNSGQRVVTIFRGNLDFDQDRYPHLWDSRCVWSPWPNTQRADQLFPFLDRQLARAARNRLQCLHVHQCVFTPQTGYLVLNFARSLRRLAERCNRYTEAWLEKQSVLRGLNVVMLDFVGTDCDMGLLEKIVRKNYEQQPT